MSPKVEPKPDPLRDLPFLTRLLLKPGFFLLKHESLVLWMIFIIGVFISTTLTYTLFMYAPH